jgi:proteasome accessory factor C
MKKPNSLFRLHRLLTQSKGGLTQERILDEMRVSRPTFFRLIKDLRENFNAPIEYNRRDQIYKYSENAILDLPASWLSHEQLTLLLALMDGITHGNNGALAPLMISLQEQLSLWSVRIGSDITLWKNKIQFVSMGERIVQKNILETTLKAVLIKKRLSILYNSILSDKNSERPWRSVSPIGLVRYRDNWYLDAYCHLREAFRSFSLAQIEKIVLIDERAVKVNSLEAKAFFADAYGIFNGKANFKAVVVFEGVAAQLASRETWHPEQVTEWRSNGQWCLKFPYGDSRELVRDICRWADGLVSVNPPALKKAVVQALRQGFTSLTRSR